MAVAKGLASHTGDRRFAGRVNIEENKNIGLIERAAEFVPEVLRSRVAMRLKEHQQAIELAAAGGFEAWRESRRMMAVVIDTVISLTTPLISKRRPITGKFDEARG